LHAMMEQGASKQGLSRIAVVRNQVVSVNMVY
jgi:hypothetical protein